MPADSAVLGELQTSLFLKCEVPIIVGEELEGIPDNFPISAAIDHATANRADQLAVLLAPYCDAELGDPTLYSQLVSDAVSPDDKRRIVRDEFTTRYPLLEHMPKLADRYADYYLGTVVCSTIHCAESIVEECAAQSQTDPSELVPSLISKVLGLQEVLEDLTGRFEVRSSEDIILTEVERNLDQLILVSNKLGALAVDRDFDPLDLVTQQKRLWGLLTSNRVHVVGDVNYRHEVNSKPGSHHSLFPTRRLPLARASTSAGSYLSFIEPVSANTHSGFDSTFGFLHLSKQLTSGEIDMVEFPVSMLDPRIMETAKGNPNLHAAIMAGESIPSNHDLWHNILPVYAESFILHHPDAPISYGGLRDRYVQFGQGMRAEKEDYEIGVGMGHAEIFGELYDNDPELRQRIEDVIEKVYTSLEKAVSADPTVAEIADYLSTHYASRLLKIFPPEHPVFDVVLPYLEQLSPAPEVIQINSVIALLFDQGTYDEADVRLCLEEQGYVVDGKDTEYLYKLLSTDTAAAQAIKKYVKYDFAGAESGAEELVNAIRAMGISSQINNSNVALLTGINKVRWLSVIGPQRRQLRGHMEKVYGKPGIRFGEEHDKSPIEVLLEQDVAISVNAEHYARNVEDRRTSQRLSKKAFDLMFPSSDTNTGSSIEPAVIQQWQQALLASEHDPSLESLNSIPGVMDDIMDIFVELRYSNVGEFCKILESITIADEQLRAFLDSGGQQPFNQLASWFANFATEVAEHFFSQRARESTENIRFIEARDQLIGRVMTL